MWQRPWFRLIPILFFPVLGFVELAAGLPALRYNAASMMRGLYTFENMPAWEWFSVSVAAHLLTAMCLCAINVTIAYGTNRFKEPACSVAWRRDRVPFYLASILAALCALLPAESSFLVKAAWWFIGFAAVFVLQLVTTFVQFSMTNRRSRPMPRPEYFLIPIDCLAHVPGIAGPFRWLHYRLLRRMRATPWPFWLRVQHAFNSVVEPALRILDHTGPGYRQPELDRMPSANGTLATGHIVAAVITGFFILIYVFFALTGRPGGELLLPALAWLILALAIWTSLASLVSFLVYQARYPAIVVVTLMVWLTGTLAPNLLNRIFPGAFEITYPVQPLKSGTVTPRQVMDAKGKAAVVLVATAGGASQAAAWTVLALQELQNRLPPSANAGRNFADSIAVISSVSGGSSGSYLLGAHFADFRASRFDKLDGVVTAPSIDEVAWGWFVPDLLSGFWPVRPIFRSLWPAVASNRGMALEQTWVNRSPAAEANATLAQWGAKAVTTAGPPAFLFNTTMVELGRPLLFCTTSLEKESSGFFEFYEGKADVRVSTAARLSAAFPYVSPATAPMEEDASMREQLIPASRRYHLVDGGYYNNYGILTSLGWARQALDAGAQPRRIILLRIEAFPADPNAPAHQSAGGAFQFMAPLKAFLNVRSNAQRDPSDALLRDYKELLDTRGIGFESYEIFYPSGVKGCEEPPLNWKLTRRDRDCLTAGWKEFTKSDQFNKLIASWGASAPQ